MNSNTFKIFKKLLLVEKLIDDLKRETEQLSKEILPNIKETANGREPEIITGTNS